MQEEVKDSNSGQPEKQPSNQRRQKLQQQKEQISLLNVAMNPKEEVKSPTFLRQRRFATKNYEDEQDERDEVK